VVERDLDSTEATTSAVLVPVFRDDEAELRVLLVQRGTGGVHGGQLGFPGGKQEPGDSSLLETALREAEEEVGLRRNEIEILTSLEPRDTRTSGFRVYPFLARITPPSQWQLAAGEIAGVITPTVRALADPSARRKQELSFPTWPASQHVECVPLEDGRLLWGLTLRLLDPVLPRLLAGEWVI
jgi:8-oxo-dGTP pyrophosphatase MutT (NUDIX family)